MIKHSHNESKPRGTLLRRLTLSLLSALLLCALIPATAAPAEALDWMTPYLDNAVQYGILREDLINNPQPNETITRGEFVAMVNRAYGYEDPGPTPFTDVELESWYYDDVGIGYNIGYFKGTSPTTASPEEHLTREQAAVILARNMMLEERSGEVLGFSDSRQFSSWSRGVIEAVAEEGVIQGFPDGSYRPQEDVTRVQVAVMLMRAVGTPLNEEGVYADRNYSGNVTITSPNVKLKDAVIDGDLYISGGVDLGGIELENVTVLGRIVVSGGGESEKGKRSVILRNVTADELLVDSITNQFVTLQAEGLTDIPEVNARTHAYIEDLTEDGLGLRLINLDGEEGATFQLAGNIKNAVNLTPLSTLNIAQGIAQIVTIDEAAVDSTLNIDGSAEVGILNLDVGTKVTGTGDISHLEVNAPGCEVEMLPDTITVRPGIEATINGETMNTQTAIESSEDPRLLTGYPAAKNVAPTSATAVFSTNKRGTVHWAVSALTSGSVSEEDLIDPPTYGGNIIKSGKLDVAASKTEYTVGLTGLTKAGSYYITAMLVDNRGYRSPVKVTAFTTPDDTVPAFINENTYTILADIGDEQVAQAMVMANKSCKLYYVLLPQGSVAPTPADFMAQSLSGSLGHGVMDIYKNEQTLISRINSIPLDEETTYDLYLWLTDADGAKSSAVKKLTLTTKDRTPPVLQQLMVTAEAANSVSLSFVLDEPGTLYWAVVKKGATFYTAENERLVAADPNALLAKMQIETGLNSLKKGSQRANQPMTSTPFTVAGLDPQTAYDLYYTVKDTAGNYAIYTLTIDHPFPIHTLDGEAPTVEQEFTHDGTTNPAHPTPFPDTSVNLVFSEHVQGRLDRDNDLVPDNDVFLTLYQQYKDTAVGRDQLAAIFRRYFKLYDASTSQQVPERTSTNENDPNLEWVVDYRYMTVAPDPSGTGELIISFPHYSDDLAHSALNLAGGTTYYFTLESIADTATEPNLMDSIRGVTTLPSFTTISAQIALKDAETERDTPVDVNGQQKLFDMTFSATPLAHDSMAPNVYWDMIFWSSSSVAFELYEKIGESWHQIGSKSISIAPASGETLGASVSYHLRGGTYNDSLQLLRDMENEGREYGIIITSIANDPTRANWNTPVTLQVTTLAGTSTSLGQAAEDITSRKPLTDVLSAPYYTVTDITTPTNFFRVRNFLDQSPPIFGDKTPFFVDIQDETAIIEVMLSRPNSRYYWVVAPLGVISTTYAGQAVNRNNVPGEGWYLMPEDGSGLYVNDVYSPTFADEGFPSADRIKSFAATTQVKVGRGAFNGTMETITVEKLTPSTQYIAYFVLEGEAQGSTSGVYCFRFETAEASRPVITLSNTSNSYVNVSVDRDSYVRYFLALRGEEGIDFNKPFLNYAAGTDNNRPQGWKTEWEATTFTVLHAMNTHHTDENNKHIGSVFDYFAAPEYKDDFITLVENTVAAGGDIILTTPQDVSFLKDVVQQVTSDDMVDGLDYTLVVMARSQLGADQDTNYAFAAVWPVFKRDNQPPYVTNVITLADGRRVLELTGNVGTSGGIRVFTTTGPFTINFSEPLYYVKSDSAVPLDGCIDLSELDHIDNSSTHQNILYTASTSITVIEGEHEKPLISLSFTCKSARVGDAFTISSPQRIGDQRRNFHTEALRIRLAELVRDEEGNYTGQAYFEITSVEWLPPTR